MNSATDLYKIFENALKQESFSGLPKNLYQPIEYTMGQNGKRLRPLLVLMTCDLFGGKTQNAITPSIAIELFHNFTLIHDDIMDQASMRRGSETVYKRWNENIAILSGDTMFALANKQMAKCNSSHLPVILDIFNQTAIEVCEGQQLDMNFESQDEVSIAKYLEMIRLKTAVLLGCSTRIGALIANANKEEVEMAWEYGINLGMAFQLKDDLLDVYGDEKVFGKRTGGDIVANKKTFLYLKALELADERTKKELIALYSGPGEESKISRVIEIFEELSIARHTESKINEYYEAAIVFFNKISVPDQNKSEIIAFTEKLMKRER